nr:MAG TPA: hypothetical protein [Caudoviricetes sp.]DAZ75018.1 MAG TPA: hypothetical protein [Caudoviricetes sp.]
MPNKIMNITLKSLNVFSFIYHLNFLSHHFL